MLLSPIYFYLIAPVLYLGIWASGNSVVGALDAGYLFSPIAGWWDGDGNSVNDGCCEGPSGISYLWDGTVWCIFHMEIPSNISWAAILETLPTLLASVMFLLFHVQVSIVSALVLPM